MKRKYYLRGLGLGILITALVFIVAGPSELSEEEIIKRAEELGYSKVENLTPSIGIKDLLETGTPVPTKTSDMETSATPVPTKSPTKVPDATFTPTPTVKPTETPAPTIVPTPTVEPVITPTEAPVNTPTPTLPVPTSTRVVTAEIIIERGNTATMVCNKLEEVGILKEGKELRDYLVENKLTDFINVGRYTLSSDMTLEEIARIITGR